VADILLSSKDFQGHLTTTWPKDSQDIPVKFTDASKVLFPYGYGLSKTSRSE
jgi:beta-glucosidase